MDEQQPNKPPTPDLPAGEEIVVICPLTSGHPRHVVHPQCQVKKCGRCGDSIWVSPTSLQAALRNTNVSLICTKCAIAAQRAGKLDVQADQRMLPGQADEIVDEIERRRKFRQN